ncbi:MAG: S41 family peptidase [Bryobacteraceae bacterium]|nr:S41 family peptidase [Bryobacteraceae bacterium]
MARLLLPLLLSGALAVQAQNLTAEQRAADLRMLAALYAKQYGPYEWKRDVIGFDLYDLRPWLERASTMSDDIEFLDLLVEYVAALDDAHDVVSFPFTFSASLPFTADLYDGRALIDSVTRSALPVTEYPIQIGDELVSVDGVSVQEWIRILWKYSIAANPRSTARNAVARITSRSQSRIPWAFRIGDTAEVVIRHQNGELRTYRIAWSKSGMPVTEAGRLPSPFERASRAGRAASILDYEDSLAPWQRPLAELLEARIDETSMAVLNPGLRPIFALPQGFQTRLAGNAATDSFTSGWWSAGGLRIGFLRIPNMSPALGTTAALQQFDREIEWMEQNTDGLVIDIMRNPGGSVLYVENLCQRLIPYVFRSIGFELRPTAAEVASFGATLEAARRSNLPEPVIAGYEGRYRDVLAAYRENRGRTGPISLTQPSLWLEPARTVYTKPIVVLIDEFSASGGDAFAATLQDNGRALLVGMRTMGAGGNVVDRNGTWYAEASTRVTRSLMSRRYDVSTPEFPPTPYIENVGVRPDVELDYMTRDNLLQNGRPFVEAFTAIAVDHIRRNR